MTKQTAIPHKHDADMVLTSDLGNMSRAKALRLGYDIDGREATEHSAKADAFASWRLSIECLPEARERASATAELLSGRNPDTLTTDQARAFLRGLPVETEETDTTETMTTTNEDPRAARLAEISGSMAAYNREMGRTPKTRTTPTTSAKGATTSDPTKLKRLTEIRLNALSMSGQERTQEAKTLRLALETHNRVGTPLAQAFAQLGFDTSKLSPSNA